MTTTIFNPKRALQLTRIIYFSMLLGISFFLVVVLTMLSEQPVFKVDFSNPLFTALFIMAGIAIPAGYFISKKMYSRADAGSSLEAKYPTYQSGLLIRLATCEGVSLFAIVCLLLTGNLFSLVFLFFALSVFILYFPVPEKIGADLNLTEREIEQLI